MVGIVCESRINALPYPFGSITESKIRWWGLCVNPSDEQWNKCSPLPLWVKGAHHNVENSRRRFFVCIPGILVPPARPPPGRGSRTSPSVPRPSASLGRDSMKRPRAREPSHRGKPYFSADLKWAVLGSGPSNLQRVQDGGPLRIEFHLSDEAVIEETLDELHALQSARRRGQRCRRGAV